MPAQKQPGLALFFKELKAVFATEDVDEAMHRPGPARDAPLPPSPPGCLSVVVRGAAQCLFALSFALFIREPPPVLLIQRTLHGLSLSRCIGQTFFFKLQEQNHLRGWLT